MSTNYPSFPEDSARADQAGNNTTMEQPPSIKSAVMLMRVGAAISAIGIIIGLITLNTFKDQLREQMEKDSPDLSESDFDTAFQVGVVLFVIVGLIAIALWLWMASANGKGKKWARIVATVLGVINVLYFLYGMTAGNQTVLSIVIAAASVLVGVAALVFMYRQDATQFYNANSGQ